MKDIRELYNHIQMVLASNSKLFLEGISSILKEKDIEVTAKVSSCEELKKCLAEIKPEFLLFDNSTFKLNIHEILDLTTRRSPDTKVILLDTAGDGVAAAQPPAHPNVIHIDKQTDSSELINTIKARASDRVYRSGEGKKLTEAESEVMRLIGEGYSNKEIATELSISEKTVKAHLTNIFTKLGIHSRYQLIVYVRQLRHRIK